MRGQSMAMWVVRAGQHGEFEEKFLDEDKVYLTWEDLNHNLGNVETKPDLRKVLQSVYPDFSKHKITQNLGQIWAFSKKIEPGDWVVLPSKFKAAIHIAEVLGRYTYHPNADDPFYHSMKVKWIETDIPRLNFDQDIRFTLGAFSTVFQVKRNDAEARIRAMATNDWKSTGPSKGTKADTDDDGDGEEVADLEQVARDQIAKFIIAKYKGHGMARLIDAVLQAQGYTTHVSPAGPDKGLDILAAPAPLGFGSPRICVQVKTSDSPLERIVLDQLIGVMQNVHADQGLLISWGGFKSSIDKEKASQFFRVRLWDQNDIINQILSNYDKLSDEIRAELPLKRIWTLTETEDEE